MNFKELQGHSLAKKNLQNALNTNRLPSAFLFLGTHGIGKTSAAIALVREIYEKTADAEKIQLQNALLERSEHPDVLLIKKEGTRIGIDKIRELNEIMHKAPVLSPLRVCILKAAEHLSEEAANAFLKTLEEPPPENLLILTAENQNQLFETVLSRCEKIYFSSLQPDELKTIYTKYSLPEKDTDFLLRFSRGRVRKNWIDRLDELRNLRELTGKILSDLRTRAIFEYFPELEKIAKAELHKEFMEFLSCWLRDARLVQSGIKEGLMNSDSPQILTAIENNFSLQGTEDCWKMLQEAESALHMNTAKQTVLEGLILLFRRISEGSPIY